MNKNQKPDVTSIVPKVSSVFGPLILGKALFYNDVCQQLYFVDMHSYDIHRFDPRTNDHIIAKFGESPLAFIIPVASIVNHFIVGAGSKIIEITWDGKSENIEAQKELTTVDKSFGCGVNNAVVTPRGSLFIATFSETDSGEVEVGKSAILKYTSKSNEITPVLTELTLPNGMTFSICGKTFYLADSHTTSVDKFCYNVETEELTNREVFFDFVENKIEGKPFNVMTDGDGRIWVAACGGDVMIRVCQHKREELLRVQFEASIITSSCFAGSFFREMYVTSGRYKLTEEELERYPKSGYFFRLTNLGSIKGLPCRAFCPDAK